LLGVALYDGNGLAPNNSIITVPSNGRIQPLKCLTGSNNTMLGHVYRPDGLEMATSRLDAI